MTTTTTPTNPNRRRGAALAAATALLTAGLAAQVALAPTASAVTATKVELKGGQLRLQGQAAPVSRVIVESTTSAASVRADQRGAYKLQASGFTAPDCTLTIRDGVTPVATVPIPGCTRSVPPVTAPKPPTGGCVITPQAPVTLQRGVDTAFWMSATGCDRSSPLWFTLVSGGIPTGMTMGTFQNSELGNIIGTPSVPGTYRFTVQAQDGAGATDQETFTITVV